MSGSNSQHSNTGQAFSSSVGTTSSQLIHLASPSSSTASTPTSKRTRTALASSPRSPAVDRLMRKISKKNGKGETALHTAAIRGSRRLVRTLLTLGADPNAQDNAQWSPLHEACNRGNVSVVKLLHEFGADLNLKGFAKDSPLHDAARNGHIKVVKYLVNFGADLEAKNASGLTARQEAEVVSLRCDNLQVKETLSYLIEQEQKRNSSTTRTSGSDSDYSPLVSSSEDEETENDEVARFLGVTKSACVVQAYQNLGLSPALLDDLLLRSSSNKTSDPSTPVGYKTSKTPLSKDKWKQVGNKKATEQLSSKVGGETVRVPSSASGGSLLISKDFDRHPQKPTRFLSKVRLTYGVMDGKVDGKMSSSGGSGKSVSTVSTEDVYEFKSSVGKEIPPSRTPPDDTSDKVPLAKEIGIKGVGSVDKQACPGDNKRSAAGGGDNDEEEEVKKKRLRKEDSKENSAAPAKTVGRSTRGSSSEKNVGKCVKVRSGQGGSGDRKTPPSSSTVNSPNPPKKPLSRDHSDGENDDEGSKESSSGLKVPPLKIVLSGGNGNGNPSSATQEQELVGVREKKASDVKSESIGDAPASSCHHADLADKNFAGSQPPPSTANSSASRVTRSRANQGTPGPSDSTNDNTGADSSNSSTGCEQGNNVGMVPSVSSTSISATTTSCSSGQANSGTSASERSLDQRSSNSSYASEYHVKKRKLRSQVEDISGANSVGSGSSCGAGSSATNPTSESSQGLTEISGKSGGSSSEPMNDIEKYLNIRRQVEQRRKNLFPVQPKPPQGFKDYLMNRRTYLLQENAAERLRSIPMIQPPPSLDGPLRQLFKEQEQERYKLRMKHVVEKEKLVLSVEQEILRVHGRAARALANQSLPFSVCTILRDEEIYTPIDPEQEEKNRDIRSRYNGRLFLSWLQDVDDKWEKIKEQMVLRHHNEAESLNAVQKMDWEWKINELSPTGITGSIISMPQVDDLHIPMVHVSDDFDPQPGCMI